MPSFEEAVRLILDAVSPQGSESVPLLDSLGRVSAADVSAPWSTPRYDNSAMDGFAVRAADCVTRCGIAYCWLYACRRDDQPKLSARASRSRS